jgi:hypothetical protein
VRESEWRESTPKPGAAFKAAQGKMLAATEEMTVASIDLREWYDLSKPGFYRLQMFPAVKDPDTSGETASEVNFSLAPAEAKTPRDT